MVLLKIDSIDIIRPDSYKVDTTDKFASTDETEAGTKQYDYVRRNVHTIEVSFTVTKKWLMRFSNFRAKDSVTVNFFDDRTGLLSVDTMMKVTDYNVTLVDENYNRPVWSISFNLEEI